MQFADAGWWAARDVAGWLIALLGWCCIGMQLGCEDLASGC